jgi:hypothetical protein
MEWNYGQTCIKRPAWGQRKKGPYKTGDLLTKRGSIHMGFSIIDKLNNICDKISTTIFTQYTYKALLYKYDHMGVNNFYDIYVSYTLI